ncbi:hypothetical protein CW304_23915 [Bacillus sp. UFRGS-B20]|nr:hypothetical protein CW304_23915 [Bacillus sp. UFRGS-B20]
MSVLMQKLTYVALFGFVMCSLTLSCSAVLLSPAPRPAAIFHNCPLPFLCVSSEKITNLNSKAVDSCQDLLGS